MNMLSSFILFCGGVDVKFLKEHCPGERNKFYPIGLGVLTTTLLAFISMMFASHAIFQAKTVLDEAYLILFSLFWAFAIFTIDWGLVKTMYKPPAPPSTLKEWWQKVFPVIFRLAVAVILSYSISRPLEVAIYDKRLKSQIEQDRQDFVAREKNKKEDALVGQKKDIEGQKTEEKTILEIKNGGPTSVSYSNDTTAKGVADHEYEETQAEKSENIRQLNNEVARLQSPSISPDAYFTDTAGKLQRKSWATARISNINNNLIPRLQAAIDQKKKVRDSLGAKVQWHIDEHNKTYDPKLKAIDSDIKRDNDKLQSSKAENDANIAEIIARSYISYDTIHPGLITQLASLSNFERTKEGQSAKLIRLILLAVIICIDTAPVVIKLMTKRGVYEELKEAEDEKTEFLSTYETYANKYLVRQLSLAQKEVMSKAIKEWKEKQLENPGLPDDYIVMERGDEENLPISFKN